MPKLPLYFSQLCGLCEALGPNISALVAPSQIALLVCQCCRDEKPSVRQSAFALMGDLARTSPAVLQGVLSDLVASALAILNPQMMNQVLKCMWTCMKDKPLRSPCGLA
jgi:transportin-1